MPKTIRPMLDIGDIKRGSNSSICAFCFLSLNQHPVAYSIEDDFQKSVQRFIQFYNEVRSH